MRESTLESLVARLPEPAAHDARRRFSALHKGLTRRFLLFLLGGCRFPWESARNTAARIALAATIIGHLHHDRLEPEEAQHAWPLLSVSAQV